MPRAWVLHRRLNKAAIDRRLVQQKEKKEKEFTLSSHEISGTQTQTLSLSLCIEIIIANTYNV